MKIVAYICVVAGFYYKNLCNGKGDRRRLFESINHNLGKEGKLMKKKERIKMY